MQKMKGLTEKKNVGISYDTMVTAVTKTQNFASSFSLDLAVKMHLRDLMAIIVQFLMSI